MRRSAAEKAQSRERILDVAAARIREEGLDRPSVAEVMTAAGLTHGGFYKHFENRDDMVLAALERAFRDNRAAMHRVIDGAADPLAAFVDWYLSTSHLGSPARMCAMTALVCDVARSEDPRLHAAYDAQVESYFDALEPLVGSRERASVVLSSLVGAMSLARAVDPGERRELILADVRAAAKGS